MNDRLPNPEEALCGMEQLGADIRKMDWRAAKANSGESFVNLTPLLKFLRNRQAARGDSQMADLLAACAERGIYSRGDLELRLDGWKVVKSKGD